MLSNRRFVLGIALCSAVALLSSCNYRSEEFRYRMTVEVDTPQGLRTGSSVIEVEVSDSGPNSFPEAGLNTKVRGEAVAVDLPGGKVLFALLSSPTSADAASGYAYKALRPPQYGGDYGFIERTKEMKRLRRLGVLRRDDYPMLATFRDLADPTSVERVDPDDLESIFGKGISLRRITVRMTDEAVTMDIENRLDWLEDYYPGMLSGDRFESSRNMQSAAHISVNSFSTELGK